MTYILNNKIAIDGTSGATDAFARMRTSEPAVLFSDKSIINNDLLWSTNATGTGTVDEANMAAASTLDLTVGTDSGASIVRQSRQRHVYQPGKSQLILATGILTPKTNVRSRFGYFSSDNGLFIEADGTNINLVKRSGSSGSVVDTAIAQASWNIDPMDGTGPSGTTMDFSTAFILFIDFEWLGVGIARMGFVIDGTIIYTHAFKHANVLNTTYMGSGTLPVRYEIENTGVPASSTSLTQICVSVISEGGQEESGVVKVVDTGTNTTSVADNNLWNPVLSVRMNPAAIHANVDVITSEILSTNKTDLSYRLIFNGTLTGASWTNQQGTITQSDTAASSITGGTHYDGGYVESSKLSPTNTFSNKVHLGFDVLGVPDTITLAIRPVSASANVFALMRILERY